MTISPVLGGTQAEAGRANSSGGTPKTLEEAAASFEALFLGQLLKSAREAGTGQLGEADQSAGTMMEVAEDYLVNQIAKGGGCGLAKTVVAQLASRAGQKEQ